MNTLDVLEAARRLLADEKNWTKGRLARTSDQVPALVHGPDASCFCVMGAVEHAGGLRTNFDAKDHAVEMLEAVVSEGYYTCIEDFNDADETTHEDVLQLFDRAIRFVATGEK